MTDKLFEDDIEELDYKYVIGQDPGGTTGVALLRYTDNTAPELVYLHQIPDGREGFFYFFVGSDVGEGTNFVSVSEKWETREGIHSANLEPVYIEGVQYAIWVDQTHYQSPRVKTVIGDEFLKINNLWTEGKRHQMDALLHALYYLRSIGHEPTLKALTGELGRPLAEPGEAQEKTLPQPGDDSGNDGDNDGDEEGQGEGDGISEIFKNFIEAMEKATQSTAEQIEALAQALESGDEESEDGEPEGPSGGFQEGSYEDDGTTPNAKPKRTLNGGFIGFEDDDE